MFNGWTFFFQLVNFFIVLYILYRLFFKPLQAIIHTREETIRQGLQEIKEGKERIKQEEENYSEKMKEIEHLREKEIDKARKEALSEKDRMMKENEEEIEKARRKQSRIIQEQQKKNEKEIRRKSLEFSLHYSEKLLKELSDETLHQKRIEQFLQALEQSKKIAELKKEFAGKACEFDLYTAFELSAESLERIKEKLQRLLQCDSLALQSTQEGSLIIGVRLLMGNTVFDASLKAELERFKEQMEKEI